MCCTLHKNTPQSIFALHWTILRKKFSNFLTPFPQTPRPQFMTQKSKSEYCWSQLPENIGHPMVYRPSVTIQRHRYSWNLKVSVTNQRTHRGGCWRCLCIQFVHVYTCGSVQMIWVGLNVASHLFFLAIWAKSILVTSSDSLQCKMCSFGAGRLQVHCLNKIRL